MLKAEIYKDSAGEWRWRIKHQNGNILADSGQGYSRRVDAINGLEVVTGTKMDGTWSSLNSKERTIELEVEFG